MTANFSPGKPRATCESTDYSTGKPCSEPALGAVRTTNGKTFQTVLFWDAETAPAAANRHCLHHFRQIAIGLLDTLMAED